MDFNNQKMGSVIAKDTELNGELAFSDSLSIHGKLEGKINSDKGSLEVGKDANVNADITSKNVTVEGKVNGTLKVADKIHLKSSSAVRGDITAARIVTEDHCVLVGKTTIGDSK